MGNPQTFKKLGHKPNLKMIHAMIDKGWTNFQLANVVGCADSFIALLRHGRRIPGKKMAEAIEKALDEKNLFPPTALVT